MVEHCRQNLRERGVPFNENTPFGVMLSVPSACLTAEEFVAHGCDFLVIGTNDLTQYTHAADRELASAEHYYRPASPAMKKLITMVMDAAKDGATSRDHLRPRRGQPGQHGAVPAAGSAQLLGQPAEPAEDQKSPDEREQIKINKKDGVRRPLYMWK